MSERKDWKRLHRTRVCKDDSTNRFFTPEDVARGIISRYEHGLKGKKIHCFADSTDSWFYKILKERFQEIGLEKLIATEWVENGKGKRAVYDGHAETLSELEDDGSLFGECSKKATAECDVVVTNPPFKKYSAMLKDVIGKKDFVLMAPHILPYRINDVENQLIYRIAKGEVFIEPKAISIWNEDHTRAAACVVISTIKPEGVEKVDIELSAKYDPAKHKMFIDVETGKPTGVVNCDRFKDFPVDWPGLVAIPVTTLIKIANQKVRVIDAHGMCGYSKYANNVSAIELVHVNDVHGMKSRGETKSPNMELVDVNDVHGGFKGGGKKIELVDSVTIHGYYGRAGYRHDGVVDTNTIELVDNQVIHGQYGRNGGENSFLSGANCMELVDSDAIHGMYAYNPDGRYHDPVKAMELVDSLAVYGCFNAGNQHSGKDLELVDSLAVHGQFGRGGMGPALETDSVAIHGFFGKGDVDNPYMQFGKHQIIKVRLEDGRVPFQRIIVKLNRERRSK